MADQRHTIQVVETQSSYAVDKPGGLLQTVPKYDLTKAPHMHLGMGVEAAHHSGYRHGYEGKVSAFICCLLRGTEERKAWLDGYREGVGDSGEPTDESFPEY